MPPPLENATFSGSEAATYRESNKPIELTFILPTRDRRRWVIRAIESCLGSHQAGINVEVLVLDGNSTDGTFEAIQGQFGSDPRVLLLRQQSRGFMAACFEGLALVRTPFATFMYDDDVLSPFWADLPRTLADLGSGFALGFGAEGNIEQTIPFAPVKFLRMVSPSALLRAYCGAGHELSQHGLPLSPICCLTRIQELRRWQGELERFPRGRFLREYFMMQLNAGPDLLVYFSSILNHEGDIPVFDGSVAQFSSHRGSMTVTSEPTDIRLGYWLAYVWLSTQLRRLGRGADAGWCAAYTLKQGLRLLWKRVRLGRWEWMGSFIKEIADVAGQSLMSRNAFAFARSLFALLLLPRPLRPGLRLPPRIARLLL